MRKDERFVWPKKDNLNTKVQLYLTIYFSEVYVQDDNEEKVSEVLSMINRLDLIFRKLQRLKNRCHYVKAVFYVMDFSLKFVIVHL